MRYLLLIYENETNNSARSEAELQAEMNEYWAFTTEVNTAGVYKGGDALQPTSTATTVRVHAGKTVITDGPFAETKEQLGGFYLLDCKNLDEALQWAAKIPGAKHGSIEVRPIMELN